MSELYRPSGEELWKKPKELEKEFKEAYQEEGADLRDVLPKDVKERLDDYSESVRAQLEEQFGAPEIQEDLQDEMGMILDSIAETVRKKGYVEEVDDEGLLKDLKYLSVKASHYKEKPQGIEVTEVPEKGCKLYYRDNDGREIERMMTPEEMDMLFNMEMWADKFNQLKNIEYFKGRLVKAKEGAEKSADETKQAEMVRRVLYVKYAQFGFTREEIDNLIILASGGDSPEMAPRGVEPGMHKLEIMLDVWKKYLSGEEKSKYIKMAAAIIGLGAAEGLTPMLFKHTMDADTLETAVLFAGSYFSAEMALGWIRRRLNIGFDNFINETMRKNEGLNDRLSKDLVFQPGEGMAEGGRHGRITSAMGRGKAALKEIIANTTKVTLPAMAGTVAGLGMMMASDWRLGIFSLLSAPVAFAVVKKTERKIEPIISKAYAVEDEIAQKIEEQMNAHMDIVLNGMREVCAPRFSELMGQSNQLVTDRTAARAMMEFRMGSMLSPAVMGALTVAGMAMKKAGVPVTGNIVAAIIYSGMFRASFDQAIRQQSQALENCASIMEMEEVFNGYADEEAKQDKSRISAEDLPDFSIKMNNVSLKIGDREIVRGVDISIPAGAVVRLEGESGHGKTTIMKLMAGYYKPSDGHIEIGETPVDDIKKTGEECLYRHTAYLSQWPYIFESDNLRKNLEFGNHDASEDEMKQVLKDLGLAERFTKRGKINLDQSITGLSGGERARLGVARTILKIRSMKGGGIVFLDEPSEGLDNKNENALADALVREKKKHPNVTFVLVSHSNEFIEKLSAGREGEKGLRIRSIKIKKGSVVNEPALRPLERKPESIEATNVRARDTFGR